MKSTSTSTSPPSMKRVWICALVLLFGLGGQWGLEALTVGERPLLKSPLASSLPMRIGDWVGEDKPMATDVLERTQSTEHVNRVYRHLKHPRKSVSLWINYSKFGDNLRHSPTICLPAGGYTEVPSMRTTLPVSFGANNKSVRMEILGYSKEDSLQTLGFWYYIFGEGWWEKHVRRLPITSRSSHGRTTRGSSMTIEVFCTRETDPDGHTIEEFSRDLAAALEPILPDNQEQYHTP